MDHQNPKYVAYQSETFTSPRVSLATNYFLTTEQLKGLDVGPLLPLNDGMRSVVPMELAGRVAVYNNYLHVGNPSMPRVRLFVLLVGANQI